MIAAVNRRTVRVSKHQFLRWSFSQPADEVVSRHTEEMSRVSTPEQHLLSRTQRREDLSLQLQVAMLFAELLNFRANFFQQLPCFRHLFRMRASELRGI